MIDKNDAVRSVGSLARVPMAGPISTNAILCWLNAGGNFATNTRTRARGHRISGVHKKEADDTGAVVIPIFLESIKRDSGTADAIAISVFFQSIKRACGALSFRYFFRHRARTRGPAAGARPSSKADIAGAARRCHG